MEWKSRRRDVPERLEPSLSSGASAEEEGLDRFVVIFKEMAMNNFQFLLYVSGCIVRSMSDLQYFKIPNKFVREIGIFFVILLYYA